MPNFMLYLLVTSAKLLTLSIRRTNVSFFLLCLLEILHFYKTVWHLFCFYSTDLWHALVNVHCSIKVLHAFIVEMSSDEPCTLV